MRLFGVVNWCALIGACFALAPARADVLVNISKAQQQLTVTVDGVETYRWPVSTGKPGYDTPSGSFTAFRTEAVYFSKKYDDAPMPHAVFFHGGYAVHGTLEQSRLGNAVSHGCVRLSRANAAILFALVKREGLSRTHIVISDARLMSSLPDPAVAHAAAIRPLVSPDPYWRQPPHPRYRSASVTDATFEDWQDTRRPRVDLHDVRRGGTSRNIERKWERRRAERDSERRRVDRALERRRADREAELRRLNRKVERLKAERELDRRRVERDRRRADRN